MKSASTLSSLGDAVASQLRSVSSAAALTGAGVSAESGLATFRSGPSALWRNHRPEDLATSQAFARDPKLVWEWYRERLQRAAGVKPNPGHYAFAALEQRIKAVVLLDGGFLQYAHSIEGLDPVDFAPRLIQPVLMVNGRFDATFPIGTAQLPLFRLLGAPAADKRHVVFDTPHDVRLQRADMVKEVLAWYDRYLGRVQ